jgi:thioesterase domain-containing protein
MNLLDFLAALRERDIQISADGDRLRCNAPVGALTPGLRDELRQRKVEILRFLRAAKSLAGQQPAVVPLQPYGTATPIFAVAGHNGDIFCFRALAQHLGDDQPFFGLQPPGLDGSHKPLARVEDLAAYFATQIRIVWPDGPYIIAGYCAGGTIAFELACQLLRGGAAIHVLALFGSPFPTNYRFWPLLCWRIGQFMRRLVRHACAVSALPAAKWRKYVTERLRNLEAAREAERRVVSDPVLVWRGQVESATLGAIRRYAPGWFAGRLSLFWPCKDCRGDALVQWPSVAKTTEKYFGPDECDGTTMLREPHVATFAKLLRQTLQGNQGLTTTVPRQSLAIPADLDAGQMKAMSL